MKHYTVLLGEEHLFATTDPIKAMAKRAIAWRKYSRIHRIILLIEEA